MQSECLELICDGQLEIIKITEKLYDAALELFVDSFMKYENISIACNLLENPDTVKELMFLVKTILKDNISFAARDIKTQQLVAICINKLVNPSANITLHKVFSSFKTPNMKGISEHLDTIECIKDIFKKWKINCAIELTFFTTRPDYGRRGIARSLVNFLLGYAAKLKENCHESQELPEHLKGQRPEAIVSVFTSCYSQALGKKLGFETLFEVENANFVYGGEKKEDKKEEKSDLLHKNSVFTAKRL